MRCLTPGSQSLTWTMKATRNCLLSVKSAMNVLLSLQEVHNEKLQTSDNRDDCGDAGGHDCRACSHAQLPEHLRAYQLSAPRASGDVVGPMFNGWIKNKDGSITMIFGFVNRNHEEIVDIP